jgi:hypothetical protein
VRWLGRHPDQKVAFLTRGEADMRARIVAARRLAVREASFARAKVLRKEREGQRESLRALLAAGGGTAAAQADAQAQLTQLDQLDRDAETVSSFRGGRTAWRNSFTPSRDAA